MTQAQTVSEKMASVFRRPLFTFSLTFPGIKKPKPAAASRGKPEPVKTAKTAALRKPARRHRPIPAISSSKPAAYRDTLTGGKNILYAFTPAQNKTDFEKTLFVLRACDKSGGGAMFANVLHVEHIRNGSRLVATDGKRLHVTDIGARLKPGNYKASVVKNRITLGKSGFSGDYPDWERAVPLNATRRGCINLKNASAEKANKTYYAFTKMSEEKINQNYLADLTKTVWEIYVQSEKRKALLLKEYGNKETYAVIMPMSA